MLYANEYWLNNKIDLSMVSYDLWVARYNTMYTVQNPSMWQATNTGAISGVNGSVDINFYLPTIPLSFLPIPGE